MELNDYQKQAMETCMESSENFSYMMLNLVGEVGEFASKVAKAIRKDWMEIGEQRPLKKKNLLLDTGKAKEQELWNAQAELAKEAGDILWQLSGLCSVMGWNLEDIAQQNLNKLKSRKERDVIDGNGDNR